MFTDSKGQQVNGLIYGSSKTKEKNIVLFCNQQQSKDFFKDPVEIEKFQWDWRKIE